MAAIEPVLQVSFKRHADSDLLRMWGLRAQDLLHIRQTIPCFGKADSWTNNQIEVPHATLPFGAAWLQLTLLRCTISPFRGSDLI